MGRILSAYFDSIIQTHQHVYKLLRINLCDCIRTQLFCFFPFLFLLFLLFEPKFQLSGNQLGGQEVLEFGVERYVRVQLLVARDSR